ncbi:carbohydrate esterase family 4 protein [Jaapia argillacea MUCL 33604]|uniref:chitin deacetylase n=1 Tax=Jaapia argillacea MUCL 33604 TaxID=933084 RepID=A0A067PJQ1_9AGAM|nr:carbohydrate esterase family 4 protein [Jaapia argillacea MUCL 33604]
MHTLQLILVALALPSLIFAHTIPRDAGHDHDETIRRALPSAWYQRDDHPAHALFKRQQASSTFTYPQVGTPAWSAGFPQSTPDSSQLPTAWVNALNAAVAAGKIPNIPPTTLVNGSPTYPQGTNGGDPSVCSGTYGCRIPGDIWDAPTGVLATGFDDGPIGQFSPGLYTFLSQNNIPATHFMIGVNILNNAAAFQQAFSAGQDIAVHTYTHPYMTTLSNLDVLAQIGWTMELIHNSTGGKLPAFWRPPYGDSDVRTRAIAVEVFGLTTIIWNHDTNDWNFGNAGVSAQSIQSAMTGWLTGPKTPGLIILEHELNQGAVNAFEAAYPLMISNGWNLVSAAQILNGHSWMNGTDNGGVLPVAATPTTSSTSTSSTAAPSSSSATRSGANGAASSSASHKSGASTTKLPGWTVYSGLFTVLLGLFSAGAVLF